MQADWQEVWHSPQPPVLTLLVRSRVAMVLIRSIIENLSNSQNFIAPDKARYAFIFAYDNTQGAFCQDFYAANLFKPVQQADTSSGRCAAPAPAPWPVSTGSGTKAPAARKCAARSGLYPPPDQTSSHCAAGRTDIPSALLPVLGDSVRARYPAGCGSKAKFGCSGHGFVPA